MRLSFLAPALVALSIIPTPAISQQTTVFYHVKFVCGRQVPPTPSSLQWDMVAPGSYFTAINLYNLASDTATVAGTFVTTVPTPVPGDAGNGPSVKIPPGRAVEFDCADILSDNRPPFLKGFWRIKSNRRLVVVAVYTAADSARVVSIDVERVP